MAFEEWAYGLKPPADADGNYKTDLVWGVGVWQISGDGTTITNLATGDTYDLSAIGSGGSSNYGDEDAQDAVGSITDASLAYDDATPSLGIAAGGVGTEELAAEAVTTPKVAPDAVTQALIASGAVGSAQLITEDVQDIVGGTAGENLTYDDANNVVNAEHVAVSEDGVEILGNPDDINFGAGVDVNDDGDGTVTVTAREVASTTANYTTDGEERVAVDTSGGAVTVTIASADAVDGNTLKVVDSGLSAAANPITVEVEGADGEVINPGGATSTQIGIDGGYLHLECVAGNWYTEQRAQKEVVDTGELRAQSADVSGSLSTGTAAIGQLVGKARSTASATAASGSTKTVPLDSIDTEDTGVVSIDTANDQAEIQSTGLYFVLGDLYWNSSSGWSTGGDADVNIVVNGNIESFGNHGKIGTTAERKRNIAVLQLSAGDTVTFEGYQTSGSGKTIGSGSVLTIARLG